MKKRIKFSTERVEVKPADFSRMFYCEKHKCWVRRTRTCPKCDQEKI